LRDPAGRIISLVGFGHGPHAAGADAVLERGFTQRRAPHNAASYLISRALALSGWRVEKATRVTDRRAIIRSRHGL
jgi:hypothetical protein